MLVRVRGTPDSSDLGGGRYDIGNYLLTLKPAKVVVTANPATDPDLGQIGDVHREGRDRPVGTRVHIGEVGSRRIGAPG